MWLMTTEGFYSVIRWHDGRMCVRARRRQDLERLRKIAPALSAIEVSPGKDYRYRCFCTAEEWQAAAAELASRIDYGNFKTAVGTRRGFKDPYERALHQIWSTLGRIQPAGPYGFGTRKGYPAVPKGEAEAVKAAKREDAARPLYGEKGFASSFVETPAVEWERHVSRVADEQLELECEECHNDAPDELDTYGGMTCCRDIQACLERVGQLR